MPGVDIPEAAKATAWAYLQRDPNDWSWDQVVRRISGIDHPVVSRPVAARLRERYGSMPNSRDFDDGRVAELIGFLLTESQKALSDFRMNGQSPIEASASHLLRRVALVSHNYNRTDGRGLWDYSQVFQQVNQHCDEQGCDTVLYSLYTWDRRSPEPKDHDAIFGCLKNVQRVLLEVGDLYTEAKRWAGNQTVEIWQRGQQKPTLAWQWFATTADMKEFALVDGMVGDLVRRRLGDALLVICGENGVISSSRATDQERFHSYLGQAGIRVILNPTHDYMKPRGSNDYFRSRLIVASQQNREVVSVWNQGKQKTEPVPWIFCQDGTDRTSLIRESNVAVPLRPDVRIGIVDL